MLRLWLKSLLVVFLAVGMVGCGDKDGESESENNNPPNSPSSTNQPSPTSKPSSTSQPSPTNQANNLRKTLEYAPAAVDNPLKGLLPYQGDKRSMFPHSLEYNNIAYSTLVKGYDRFDWQPLETMLNDIASRGHQAVLRIYLEYPDQKTGIPQFLIKDGLKIIRYPNANSSLKPPSQAETPNYEDKNLRRSLNTFVRAFGKKYDGDPRIGFLTAGLLGSWGEWHTDPRNELFASKTVQKEVLAAYAAAFKVTPVLLRYPVGENDPKNAANAQLKFGYHDDSFAWATLDTGKKDQSWFYMPTLKAAGTAAEAKWKIAPIGGEIRPEAWGEVFDTQPSKPEIQSFRKSVEATHATWMLDSGMFREKQDSGRIDRATSEVRKMGYEFHVPAVQIDKVTAGKLPVNVELVNRGVAPFYYDWPIEFGVISGGKLSKTFAGTGKITGLLPNDPARKWNDLLDLKGLAAGDYQLVMRVPNRLPKGKPIRFANKSQDADLSGWLTLGDFKLP
jgi:Domain of unknown function (DUF4832)